MKLKYKNVEIDTRNTTISIVIIVALTWLLSIGIITAGKVATKYFNGTEVIEDIIGVEEDSK